MKQFNNTIVKSFIFILTLSVVSLTVQARESLEALRNDLNSSVTTLQEQINMLQTQLDAIAPIVYTIGAEGPAGGIVFYLTDAGTHGLEAAPMDQGTAPWGCYGGFNFPGETVPGADGTAIGTGAQNTIEILNYCNEPLIAAEIADTYSLNGFEDWYLPSRDELNLLFSQKDAVGLAINYYWSSSEVSTYSAWSQHTYSGQQLSFAKEYSHIVRAIRSF